MYFWDIKNLAFSCLGYEVSYVELIGTIFGLASVYYASKANILTWGTGLVNVICLFILFFQIQLYADMFLQVYFFVVTIYGWYNWKYRKEEIEISTCTLNTKSILAITIIAGTAVSGYFFSNLHLYLPSFFTEAAAYPYIDSLVMVSSIIATVLLAQKKIETWYLWIAVDLICVGLFFVKGTLFLSIEYFIFLGLASYGWYNWRKGLAINN